MRASKVLSYSAAAALTAGTFVPLTASASLAAIQPASTSSGKPVSVYFVTYASGYPYVDTEICGAEAAAKAYSVKLKWTASTGVTVAAELADVNAAVQTHPEGILVDPANPTGLIAALKQAVGQGAALVTIDGQLSQKIDTANLITNNLEGGALAADALGAALKGHGMVGIGALDPSAIFNAERVTGFVNELKKKFPNIKTLPIEYDNGDPSTSAQHFAAELVAHPDLGGVYAAQETAGEGAVSALKAAHKIGTVKVVSYDTDPAEVAGLRAGDYLALVGQSPYYQGYTGTKLLAELIRGQVKASAVAYEQYTPVMVLTKANVNTAAAKPFEYSGSCS